MATLKCFSAVSLCLLLLPAVLSTDQCSQTENSYLWRVEVSPPVYIFGTIHLPYNTLWDRLPENVKGAFSSSRDVFLELQLSSRDTSNSLQECQLLPYDRTIDTVLPSTLVTRIGKYFARVKRLFPGWLDESDRPSLFLGGSSSSSDQLFAAVTHDWRRKKPIWVLTLLSSLTEENIRHRKTPVLDRFFDNIAGRLGKNLTALETPNDHCQPLNRLSDNQVERLLRIELDYLESLVEGPPGTMERDLNEYICGDLQGLIESQPILPIPPLSELSNVTNITSEDTVVLQQVETMLNNRLITRRNRRMTKTIDTLLRSQRTKPVFIAVGAGHLLGSKNIIDRLQRKSYVVHHIQTTETVEGPNLPGNVVALGDPGSLVQPHTILVIPDEEEPVLQPNPRRLPGLDTDTLDFLFDKYNIGNRRRRRLTSATAHQIEQRDTDSDYAANQIEQRDADSDDEYTPSSAHSHHNSRLLLITLGLSTVLYYFSRLLH